MQIFDLVGLWLIFLKQIAKICDPSCWLVNNAKFEHSRDLVIENSQNLRSLGHLFD